MTDSEVTDHNCRAWSGGEPGMVVRRGGGTLRRCTRPGVPLMSVPVMHQLVVSWQAVLALCRSLGGTGSEARDRTRDCSGDRSRDEVRTRRSRRQDSTHPSVINPSSIRHYLSFILKPKGPAATLLTELSLTKRAKWDRTRDEDQGRETTGLGTRLEPAGRAVESPAGA